MIIDLQNHSCYLLQAMSTTSAEKSFWYDEPSHEGCIHKFECLSRDMHAQSDFQAVEVVNTITYGTMLMLDKQVQSSSIDEFIYHESLVHSTLLSLPEPAKRVFIGLLLRWVDTVVGHRELMTFSCSIFLQVGVVRELLLGKCFVTPLLSSASWPISTQW